MRRTTILLVLVMTVSGCMSPQVFRATVTAGLQSVVLSTVVVAAVAHLAHRAIAGSLARRANRAEPEPVAPPAADDESIERRWAQAQRNRRR